LEICNHCVIERYQLIYIIPQSDVKSTMLQSELDEYCYADVDVSWVLVKKLNV